LTPDRRCGIFRRYFPKEQVNQTEIKNQEPQKVVQVVEHLFRHEAGKMATTLTGIFGIEHLTLMEDVVQESLAQLAKLMGPEIPD